MIVIQIYNSVFTCNIYFGKQTAPMKTPPSEALIKARIQKKFWLIVTLISLCLFLAGIVITSILRESDPDSKFYQVLSFVAHLGLPVCLCVVNRYMICRREVESLEFRNSHPSFSFHDCFMENKEELLKSGSITTLDQAIRQAKEKNDNEAPEESK